MTKTLISIFNDSQSAGKAVSELKSKGFSDSISVVSKDEQTGQVTTQNVDQKVSDGAAAGITAGAVVGGVAALLAGAASFVVPGAGLLVLGPLATVLAGTAAGAATGGIVGALVDLGIPEDQAKKYETAIKTGQVLVSVAVPDEEQHAVQAILNSYGGDTYSIGQV